MMKKDQDNARKSLRGIIYTAEAGKSAWFASALQITRLQPFYFGLTEHCLAASHVSCIAQFECMFQISRASQSAPCQSNDALSLRALLGSMAETVHHSAVVDPKNF